MREEEKREREIEEGWSISPGFQDQELILQKKKKIVKAESEMFGCKDEFPFSLFFSFHTHKIHKSIKKKRNFPLRKQNF